jgi:hypothetical protein
LAVASAIGASSFASSAIAATGSATVSRQIIAIVQASLIPAAGTAVVSGVSEFGAKIVPASGLSVVFAVGAVGRPSIWAGGVNVVKQDNASNVVVVDMQKQATVITSRDTTVVVTGENQTTTVPASGPSTNYVVTQDGSKRVKVTS